ncbi:MAG: M4 family metallopeptidase [Micrococcales bacterium]|nr:M4 family metallopeptidase [Micrococcales bacterium]
MAPGIVPPFLLTRIARATGERLSVAPEAAAQTLRHDRPMRSARISLSIDENRTIVAEVSDAPNRTIGDARNTETLPGRTARSEGEDPVADATVNEAYDGLGATFDLYSQVYGRNSIDGKGLPLDATVHYGSDYDNAFWNGERMVFGDGDGEVFGRFTASVSVIGHELTHGVTQYTAALNYANQAGALNESISDVFGALVEQHSAQQTASAASWLIGEGLFTPSVRGVALRSMKAPGTAYDDPVLGTDPQPATMAGYVTTREDNGGVHINSGIPNRAFYLLATTLGGRAWERAGQIWYDTLLGKGGKLPAAATFARFARATVSAAGARYGGSSPEADAVRSAWTEVGVTIDGGTTR